MEERRSLPPHEDELSLALLRSAEHDGPSSAALTKVAAALGVGAAVGLGASVPAPAVLASSGLSTLAVRWSSTLLGKVVVGVSSLMLVAGGIALLRHRASASERASSVAARVAHGAGRALLPAIEPAATPAPSAAAALPSTPPSVAAPSTVLASAATEPTPSSSNASASPLSSASAGKSAAAQSAQATPVSAPRVAKASSLPEQVSSLDRARVALNSGDASAALAEISRYRSTWPKGVFLTEASVLEIEALAKSGQVALAGKRARAFVTAHPDSPQVARLRALIPSDAQ